MSQILTRSSTSDLASLNNQYCDYVVVDGVGIFGFTTTGPANGTTIFAASYEGTSSIGFWKLLSGGSGGGGSSYLVYTALLTQSGTDAPVATVLENTLGGTVVWTQLATGTSLGELAGAFTVGKTTVLVSGVFGGIAYGYPVIDTFNDGNQVEIDTFSDFIGTSANGILFKTFVEIRVYP